MLGLVEGRGPRPALVGQLVSPRLQPADLAPGPLGRPRQAVEHLDQLALTQAGIGVVGLGVAHLHDEGEAQDGEQHRDDHLAPRRSDEGVAQALAAGLGLGVGAMRGGVVRLMTGLVLALVTGLGIGFVVRHGNQAWKTCLRMAATLEKMRMPSTTTTPVLSWDPTPSWSPR